jgi:hypothetical protein
VLFGVDVFIAGVSGLAGGLLWGVEGGVVLRSGGGEATLLRLTGFLPAFWFAALYVAPVQDKIVATQ